MIVEPTDNHKAFMDDIYAQLKGHSEKLDLVEQLALMSVITGALQAQLLAYGMDAKSVLEIISNNMKIGASDALVAMSGVKGHA